MCEVQSAITALRALKYTPIPPFVYSMAGVPVDGLAIGAPFSWIRGFDDSFGAQPTDASIHPVFQWATQCYPVLTTNPVKCHTGGNVTAGTNKLTVNSNGCEVTTPIYSVNPTSGGASAAGACTKGQNVGRATIVFGSVNDHAGKLAGELNDQEFNATHTSRPTYAAWCSVDIGPTIQFRLLNYSRVTDYPVYPTEAYAFAVHGSNMTCTPRNGSQAYTLNQFLTPTALATGAAASWQLLIEGAYKDGFWETLWEATVNNVLDNYTFAENKAFKDSQNPLEDILGVVSGVALGNFWGMTVSHVTGEYTDVPLTSGTFAVTGLRVGPASAWAIVYCLPLFFTSGLLMYLIRRTRRLQLERGSQLKLVRTYGN
jgi:hypothetical protein